MRRLASADDVRAVLGSYVSRMTAASIARSAADRAEGGADRFERDGLDARTLSELRAGVSLFVPEQDRGECLGRLADLASNGPGRKAPPPRAPAPAAPTPRTGVFQEINVRDEGGIIDARTQARTVAATIGFDPLDQHKVSTVVSELSRNVLRYAGEGTIRFGSIESPRRGMFIVAADDGPGIAHLDQVLSGAYPSRTGLGKGILGCKRLMDELSIDTAPGRGTVVKVRKYL